MHRRSSETSAGLGFALAFAAAGCLVAGTAEAHTAVQDVGSFWSGVAHLLTSLDQLAFLLGLAIWTRFHQPWFDPRIIAAVFAAVFVGVFLGNIAQPAAEAELPTLIAALMIAVGVAAAVRLNLGTAPLFCLASAGGIVLGASATNGADGLSLALFSLGTSVAGASVLSYALLGARAIEVEWGRIAMRAGASWIAAIGLMVFALGLVGKHGRT